MHSTLFTVVAIIAFLGTVQFIVAVTLAYRLAYNLLMGILELSHESDFANIYKYVLDRQSKFEIVFFYFYCHIPVLFMLFKKNEHKQQIRAYRKSFKGLPYAERFLHECLFIQELLEGLIRYQDGEPLRDHWRVNMLKPKSLVRTILKGTLSQKTTTGNAPGAAAPVPN